MSWGAGEHRCPASPQEVSIVLTGRLLADDFLAPNGLAFSADETILYVNDFRRGHMLIAAMIA
jgi:hypothetical protein